jgi:hypothetical protein
VTEEGRVFLRTAVYALGVAAIYWFVSYEVAGTVMLVVLGIAAAALTAMLPGTGGRTTPLGVAKDLATFGEQEVPALELEAVPLPTLSLMPLFVAVGAVGVTMGLVFGAWLWLPGALTILGAGWHWLRELD